MVETATGHEIDLEVVLTDVIDILEVALQLEVFTALVELLVVVFRFVVKLVTVVVELKVIVELFGVVVILIVNLKTVSVRLIAAVELLAGEVGLECGAVWDGPTVLVELLGVVINVKLEVKLLRFAVELGVTTESITDLEMVVKPFEVTTESTTEIVFKPFSATPFEKNSTYM